MLNNLLLKKLLELEQTKPTYHGVIKQIVKTENFNISLTFHEANSNIPKHCHEKPYLCLLISGTYEENSNKSYVIDSGTVVFRNAFYEHANMFSNNKNGICLNIEFDDPQNWQVLNNTIFSPEEFIRKGSIELYKLLHHIVNKSPLDILDIHCFETALSYFDQNKICGKLTWINTIKEKINDEPLHNISLNHLSNKFQLHPNYIVRKFKEKTGYKLSEYVAKVRVEKSLNEMITTKKYLTNISIGNGFFDQSHFNKNFRKFINITPTEYRNSLQRLVSYK